MQVSSLQLIGYRNYGLETFSFTDGTNIIYGNNGQGKTNLLESIFLMCRGYSHRGSKFQDLIGFDQKAMSVAMAFTTSNAAHRSKLVASFPASQEESGTKRPVRRKWELDQKSQTGFSAINRMTACILFEPNDLEIVKASPERRRRFINEELSGLNPAYRTALKNYERIRQQRNALLKKIRLQRLSAEASEPFLTVWDTQLAEAAKAIFVERANYLIKLNREAKKIHRTLSGTDEVLSLDYQSNVFSDFKDLKNIQQIYLDKLISERAQDIERGFTGSGPHADELVIKINGRPARQFASQGQQRTAAISLKLAHLELYRESYGEMPVVLLDDILSELDATRQENLLTILSDAQSFITCTDPSFADKIRQSGESQEIRMFHIDHGQVDGRT